MSENLTTFVNQNISPSVGRRFRAAIADAYAAIRSAEANQAIASVTLEQLISDQIVRNGESSRSNASQFDPYGFDPDAPEGQQPSARVNFLSGTDISDTRPTKLDRVLAIRNEIDTLITELQNTPPATLFAEDEALSDDPVALQEA